MGVIEVLRFIVLRLKDEFKVVLEIALTSGKISRISYAEYDWLMDVLVFWLFLFVWYVL